MNDYPLIERPPKALPETLNCRVRIPGPAQARLLLHNLEADPLFGETLRETLPDEETRLAYLNHLAWQARS